MLLKFTKSDGKVTKLRTKMEVTGRPISVGRGSSADIQIDDEKSSRVHCGIIYWDGVYVLRDYGSSNGTYVNDEKVNLVELKADDVVRIGNTSFTFKAEGTPADVTVMKEDA